MTHTRRADLAGFFECASKLRGKVANTFYLVQPGDGLVEGYVLASKKGVDKRATLRNRAKRRLRVAQRQVLQKHPIVSRTHSIRWVLMAGRGSLKAPWNDILREVEDQWLSVIKTLP